MEPTACPTARHAVAILISLPTAAVLARRCANVKEHHAVPVQLVQRSERASVPRNWARSDGTAREAPRHRCLVAPAAHGLKPPELYQHASALRIGVLVFVTVQARD